MGAVYLLGEWRDAPASSLCRLLSDGGEFRYPGEGCDMRAWDQQACQGRM
jgi:hypothetical protein